MYIMLLYKCINLRRIIFYVIKLYKLKFWFQFIQGVPACWKIFRFVIEEMIGVKKMCLPRTDHLLKIFKLRSYNRVSETSIVNNQSYKELFKILENNKKLYVNKGILSINKQSFEFVAFFT